MDMNCRKARLLLNNKNVVMDMELIKHLKICPSCAREAHASEILESALRHERKAQPSPETPFNILRAKVDVLSTQRTNQEKSIMSGIKNQFARRPRLVAGFGLALIAFLFVTLFPFSYTRTIGYTVSFSNVGDIANQISEPLVKVLNSMGYNDINIVLTAAQRSAEAEEFKITGLPTRESAREASQAFQKLAGISAEPLINKVTEKTSGSLYAQALDKQRTIEIDAAGKSDPEIEAELTQKLTEAGYQGNVSVTTSPSGERQVVVSMSKEAGDTSEQEQLMINCKDSGDSGKIGIGLPIPLKIETEGKTDDQIIQEVKAKLAEQGITDAEITVSPGPDGKKMIEVKVQKEERR